MKLLCRPSVYNQFLDRYSIYSVRASVIPCDIDGGLSEMSFLIFLNPKHDSVGIFAKKIKMADMLGWVKNPFFTSKIQKASFFTKVLPRFVVRSTCVSVERVLSVELTKKYVFLIIFKICFIKFSLDIYLNDKIFSVFL
jgi:hypothetical protein